MHYFAGEDYVKALPDHGKPREYIDATQPLVKIIEQLAKRKDSNQVYIKQPGFTCQDGETIRRRNPRLIVAVSSLEFDERSTARRSSGIVNL